MKARAKPIIFEAVQYKGQGKLLDGKHDTCRVIKTMRGHFMQQPDGMRVPIKMNDWVVTCPGFRILSNAEFIKQFDLFETIAEVEEIRTPK